MITTCSDCRLTPDFGRRICTAHRSHRTSGRHVAFPMTLEPVQVRKAQNSPIAIDWNEL